MARMARRKVRREAGPDLEIRLPNGQVVSIEVKRVDSGVAVRDLAMPAAMHISGASGAAVGAASVLGWYVRSDAPWSRGDSAAIRNDWQTVGDDLWRATGEIMHGNEDDDRPRLFDPGDYAQSV
jgi:hypothetical protein